jgi:hypothetical protein
VQWCGQSDGMCGCVRAPLTLIGADAAVHRESSDVGSGVLLWKAGEMTFLLRGTDSKADAIRLALQVDR